MFLQVNYFAQIHLLLEAKSGDDPIWAKAIILLSVDTSLSGSKVVKIRVLLPFFVLLTNISWRLYRSSKNFRVEARIFVSLFNKIVVDSAIEWVKGSCNNKMWKIIVIMVSYMLTCQKIVSFHLFWNLYFVSLTKCFRNHLYLILKSQFWKIYHMPTFLRHDLFKQTISLPIF